MSTIITESHTINPVHVNMADLVPALDLDEEDDCTKPDSDISNALIIIAIFSISPAGFNPFIASTKSVPVLPLVVMLKISLEFFSFHCTVMSSPIPANPLIKSPTRTPSSVHTLFVKLATYASHEVNPVSLCVEKKT
ncbi:hypothetical protein ACI68E_002644 [Malassezia pachydermatis]